MSAFSDEEFLSGAFIQEGVSPAPGVLVVCATVGDDDEHPETRIGIRRAGHWAQVRVDGQAGLSVDAEASGQAYVLAQSGAVIRFDWAAPAASVTEGTAIFENPIAEGRGPMRRLRVLGDDVISVGSMGQAYRLTRHELDPLPKLVVAGRSPTIEDLAGSSGSDFVVATADGDVAHFDGHGWQVLDFPSGASFTSICMTRPGHYAVCGKGGAVVGGRPGHWVVTPKVRPDVNYWGIATEAGRVYAAHLGGIDEILPTGVKPIQLPTPGLDFTVLRGSADGVWSFANRTIGRITNGVWATLTS